MKRLALILLVLFLVLSGWFSVEYLRGKVIDTITPREAVDRKEGMIPLPCSRPRLLPQAVVLDSSYYDLQSNGSLNRRVWVNEDGTVHATYMKSPNQDFTDREMYYYYSYYGDFWGMGAYWYDNGDGSLSSYPVDFTSGAVAVIGLYDMVAQESKALVDVFQGLGAFMEYGTNPADEVMWPRVSVNSDGSKMIIGTLAPGQTVNGISGNVAYDRAEEAYSEFSQTWTWLGFDSTDWVDADMQWPAIMSGDSGRVGIVIPDYTGDIHFFESTDNGISFAETLITTAAVDTIDLPAGPDSAATVFLPWHNVDIVYTGTEPHIVWTALQGARVGGEITTFDYRTRILHWSPSTGIDTVVVSPYQAVHSSYPGYVNPGMLHATIDWPQIGVSPDGNTLFMVYVAFNPDDVDPGNNIGFGDIMGLFTRDNGDTWSLPVNITNPTGYLTGSDDRYPSLSPVNHEANIDPGLNAYITYQADDAAGSYVLGEESANWDYYLFTGVGFPELNITLDVVPDTTRYLRGDSLGFQLTIVNTQNTSVSIQMWTEIEAPWGQLISPFYGPIDIYLGPYSTYDTHIEHYIPLFTPYGGPYVYRVKIGTYPEYVLAHDHFDFYIDQFGVELTPDAPYFYPGGNMGYTVTVTNKGDTTVVLDGWSEVETPWGQTISPVLEPISFELSPYESLEQSIGHAIPGNTPVGGPYLYRFMIGVYSDTVFADDSFEFDIATYNLSVVAVPDTTHYNPGDTLEFDVQVHNNTDATVPFELWTECETPWGQTFSPLIGPDDFELEPYGVLSTRYQQQLPMVTPYGGPYHYRVIAGTYPDEVLDDDSFDLYIVPRID